MKLTKTNFRLTERNLIFTDISGGSIILKTLPISPEEYEAQKQEPRNLKSMCSGKKPKGIILDFYWAYKDEVYNVMDMHQTSEEEIILRIKYEVLKEKKRYEKMTREVKAYQAFEKAMDAKRERIPEEVRMYVWRRDGGKCARCGINEKLEYDHIVPLSKGGNNTERNIELLCEKCNRSKSNNV